MSALYALSWIVTSLSLVLILEAVAERSYREVAIYVFLLSVLWTTVYTLGGGAA